MPSEAMFQDFSTLIFDLDGTISDPSLGIGRCFNYALTAHGFGEVSKAQVAATIGPPLDEAFADFCPEADKAVIASLVRKYRERYADIGYSENQIYPDMVEVLRALSVSGVPMGVCTSKREDFAEKILAMFQVLPYFQFVDGGDVGIRKLDQLEGLLKRNCIDMAAIMIGDRAVDISAAKANGLRSIGVLWGFGDLTELEAAGADAILTNPFDLRRLGL
jgi:phosphoglycolate phosphatase